MAQIENYSAMCELIENKPIMNHSYYLGDAFFLTCCYLMSQEILDG